jgi:uncharacterized membrane protein
MEMMNIFKNEKLVHRIFDISLILKGIHSAIEIIGGLAVLFISQEMVANFVLSITQEELSEDPHDALSHYIIIAAQHYSMSAQHFIAFYLLSHGIIKGFLVINLFKEKLWAYPLAMFAFSLFGIYQIVEFFHRGGLWLLALTALDIFLIVLTWHEYNYIKKTGIKPKWNDAGPVEGQ